MHTLTEDLEADEGDGGGLRMHRGPGGSCHCCSHYSGSTGPKHVTFSPCS